MSLRWTETCQLVLRPDGALLQHWPRGWGHEPSAQAVLPLQADAPDLDAALQAADQALAQLGQTRPLRGARLQVVLGDAWATLAVTGSDLAHHSDTQLQLLAQASLAEVWADDAPPLHLRWALQPGTGSLLIAAMEARCLNALHDLAQRHGLQLHTVLPECIVQWNACVPKLKALPGLLWAHADADHAVVAWVQQGQVVAISQGPLAPGNGALDAMADQLVASLGLEPSAIAQRLLSGDLPDASPAWHRAETRRPPVLTPGQGLDLNLGPGRVWGGRFTAALLLASLALVVGAAWQIQQAGVLQARQTAQAQALQVARPAARTPGPLAPADEPTRAREVAAAQLLATLDRPWRDLFGVIVAHARKSVMVLALEPTAATGAFRLTAEAGDAQHMLGYLQDLQSDARVSEVSLVSHQLQVQQPGQPLRFQIQGVWGRVR